MFFVFVFDIDKNVIEVYYHKNIKLFCQDLIDIALERGWYIGQSERYHLVLEKPIAALKGYFLFIAFLDPYLMVGIGQIKLNKTSNPTYLIQWFTN